MTENKEFKMKYTEMRLLLLHRSQYRSRFSMQIRKFFKRFGVKEFYDNGIGYLVELYDFVFCSKKINAAHKLEMLAILKTMDNYLPEKPHSILDIGSGFGGIDLVLFDYFASKPTMYLLDKDSISNKTSAGYHKTADSFAPYNSFQYARSFLERNGVPRDKVKTININKEPFPADVKFDMVVSLLSWGFHFPVDTYIEEVHSSLVSGGSLIMDIRKDTNGIEAVETVFSNSVNILYEEKKFVRIGIKKSL